MPSIKLYKVDVQNMLADYDSLIEQDNDNLLSSKNTPILMGRNSGLKVSITDSSFKDSAFCSGMIVYK